jgi:hypothetical protein
LETIMSKLGTLIVAAILSVAVVASPTYARGGGGFGHGGGFHGGGGFRDGIWRSVPRWISRSLSWRFLGRRRRGALWVWLPVSPIRVCLRVSLFVRCSQCAGRGPRVTAARFLVLLSARQCLLSVCFIVLGAMATGTYPASISLIETRNDARA